MRARSLTLEFAPLLLLLSPVAVTLPTANLLGSDCNGDATITAVSKLPMIPSPPETNHSVPMIPRYTFKVPSTGAGKRGIAYEDPAQARAFDSPAIGWSYNWNARPPPSISVQGVGISLTSLGSFVPMCWGERSFATWHQDAEWAIRNGATSFLGFNEPDHAEQAHLSPAKAAEYWMKYLQPYAGRVRLGSPATTNSNQPGQGIVWMKEFLSICAKLGCTMDFLAVHWYNTDPVGSAERFKEYVAEISHLAGGKSVWITEFGVWGASDAVQAEWLEEVMPWLDSNPTVERYAYFAAINNHLVNNGQLTLTGLVYNS
ncbi:glycoside hydrolase [Ascodesmis nigricans]|uniref:Glycoside hydrolase n=1 Tax=Ascodesmis nigricans TaxID=341454 RepID=A0A4S2N8F2_9PEZI|nr:glycoside hydrolase [Ascodesmis nigricans]